MTRPVLQLQQESAPDRALEKLLEHIVKTSKRDLNHPGRRTTQLKPADLDKLQVLLDVEFKGQRFVLTQHAIAPPAKVEPTLARETLSLSPREQEIARMVMKGYPNKTIAAVLDISVWTVGTHLRRIFSKLGVGNRASMVAQLLDGKQPERE